MDKWQRSFAGKLEAVRMHWQKRFERVSEEVIGPVFADFDGFTTARGFMVATPNCESGARLFKFGLTENAYLMLWFRLHGFEAVEAHAEIVVPGESPQAFTVHRTHLAGVAEPWVQDQFRTALDRFVDAFDAASRRQPAHADEHARG